MAEDIKCPNCGSETVVRTAKKGPGAGRSFHVCTRYPECKGKIAIEEQNDTVIQEEAAHKTYDTGKIAIEEQNGTIIQAEAVHKTYDTGKVTVDALRGLDLSITRGEMVAVMGPSGCGKTTLLNVLSGLDDVTGGQVTIEGASIHAMSDKRRTSYRANRMGFIFQSFNLLPVLSAVENVELPLLMAGVKSGNARGRAQEALALVGLAEEALKLPAEMSGGQQQRATVARALVNEPAIVWADEPTGNLDSENATEVMDLLCRLNKEKAQTFVIVTHDLAVGRRTHRILRMADGTIVEELRMGGC